uniref:(northern house mosquito) hypothetical protein n=1 Tax=Culex pipiens TaxID=7175 RepID=A0A8D8IZK0_CULPI
MEQDNPLDVDISATNPTGSTTVDKFCRLCLEVQPDLLPLKSRLGALPVPKMFALLTGLEIDFDDDYPKVACSQCFFRLEQAYQTRKDFLDNYHTLMSIVIAAEGPEACPAENVVREEIVGDEDSGGISTIKEESLSDSKVVEIREDCSEKLESPEDDDLDDDECVPYESIKDELYEQKITPRKKPKISLPKLSSPISIYEKKETPPQGVENGPEEVLHLWPALHKSSRTEHPPAPARGHAAVHVSAMPQRKWSPEGARNWPEAAAHPLSAALGLHAVSKVSVPAVWQGSAVQSHPDSPRARGSKVCVRNVRVCDAEQEGTLWAHVAT